VGFTTIGSRTAGFYIFLLYFFFFLVFVGFGSCVQSWTCILFLCKYGLCILNPLRMTLKWNLVKNFAVCALPLVSTKFFFCMHLLLNLFFFFFFHMSYLIYHIYDKNLAQNNQPPYDTHFLHH
jgi:hypothetical protein